MNKTAINMAHRFTFIDKNDNLITVDNVDLIPRDFKNIIEFIPEVPPPPHTHEQHEELEKWNIIFQELMQIEKSR